MPKITVTFDIPEKTETLFQEYDNIPTYRLTQHDQYAIRNLLEETLDRNSINYQNPTENALIHLLSTTISQQRPDDKRIDQYDDRTKYINPLNNLIWQIN